MHGYVACGQLLLVSGESRMHYLQWHVSLQHLLAYTCALWFGCCRVRSTEGLKIACWWVILHLACSFCVCTLPGDRSSVLNAVLQVLSKAVWVGHSLRSAMRLLTRLVAALALTILQGVCGRSAARAC
jgi:hypothetical protein